MSALERVLLAADLLEPSAPGEGEAHGHLMKECPWYAEVAGGESAGDPGTHCKPATGKSAVKLTPRTPEASTVPKPTVPPGGPGLFHIKGRELPPYIQHLYAHLKAEYGPQKAYGVAVGVVKKWAAGIHPGGKKGKGGKQGRVHADVQAAAQKNVAQWEKDKADAHAQSRGHERGTVKASAPGDAASAAAFPGQKQIPLPPVPGTKTAKAMYTAHRLNDSLFHLSHAAQRLGQARQGRALRGYHMIHVNNHLSHSLDDIHNLVASVRKNYLPEARELDALTRTMGLAKSVSTDAKVATFSHLLQTLLYHLAHAKRHAELMLDPDPAAVWRFNYDHAYAHLEGALEHCYKLARHVEDNYPDEARWLGELAKAEDPHDPFTGLAAGGSGPSKTKAEAHYRESGSPARRCGTCSMFRVGSCTLVKGSIEADDVCDYWEQGKKVALASPAATAPGAQPIAGPRQTPAQTVSPSPPLPPQVKLPTAAEVRKLIAQVPECTDASLSQSARNHLDAAATKLGKDDPIAALHVLRAAQSDVYAAHKADLGAAMPSAYTASVFTRVPSAEQSSANTAMLRSKDKEMAWRRLEQQVASHIDRIRRRHFHGMYPSGMQQARFTGESALEKVVRLSR